MEAASDAPNLPSSLNQSAFNLGNATGAALGGGLTLGMGYGSLPWLGAGIAALARGLVLTARRTDAAPGPMPAGATRLG